MRYVTAHDSGDARVVLIAGGPQKHLDICHSISIDADGCLYRRYKCLSGYAFEKFEQFIRDLKRILSFLFGPLEKVFYVFVHGLQKLVHPLVFEVGSDIEKLLTVRRMFYLLLPVEYTVVCRYLFTLHQDFYLMRVCKDVTWPVAVLRRH